MAHLFDNILTPTRQEDIDDSWRRPLELVAGRVKGDHRYRFFEAGDFMIMYKVLRPAGDLVVYKHAITRRWLHLDPDGNAFAYIAPPDFRSDDDPGVYERCDCLEDALDHLGLWELPWMKPGLEGERQGLSVGERWRAAPDEIERFRAGGRSRHLGGTDRRGAA